MNSRARNHAPNRGFRIPLWPAVVCFLLALASSRAGTEAAVRYVPDALALAAVLLVWPLLSGVGLLWSAVAASLSRRWQAVAVAIANGWLLLAYRAVLENPI